MRSSSSVAHRDSGGGDTYVSLAGRQVDAHRVGAVALLFGL